MPTRIIEKRRLGCPVTPPASLLQQYLAPCMIIIVTLKLHTTFRRVVCGQPWVVVLTYGGHGGGGVGVTLEVRINRFVMGENGGRESGKNPRWVTRGGESESDVGVGVTLEVRLHRFKKS